MVLLVAGLLMGVWGTAAVGKQNLGEEMVTRIVAEMQEWAKQPILLEALRKANRENRMSLAEIMEKDGAWRQAKQVTPFIQQFLTNAVAHYLQEIQADSGGLYAEILITDTKGVIIAETSRTTDYYQADEEWWVRTYNGGTGYLFRSKPLFDESSQSYNIDLCLPIYESQGQEVIGILKAGVSILKLAQVN
jgi:hypothetical protein